jgi:hypothetical protein
MNRLASPIKQTHTQLLEVDLSRRSDFLRLRRALTLMLLDVHGLRQRWTHDVLSEMTHMKRLVVLATLLALGQTTSVSAAPVTVSGPAALALASVVAQHSPLLSTDDKGAMASLFGGDSGILRPIRKTLSVTADSVVCRVSNVDITARHCELSFDTSKLTLSGREANELGATLTAAGVPVEGAAGSMIEGVSKLVCMIELNEIRQMAGAGATCTFETAQRGVDCVKTSKVCADARRTASTSSASTRWRNPRAKSRDYPCGASSHQRRDAAGRTIRTN